MGPPGQTRQKVAHVGTIAFDRKGLALIVHNVKVGGPVRRYLVRLKVISQVGATLDRHLVHPLDDRAGMAGPTTSLPTPVEDAIEDREARVTSTSVVEERLSGGSSGSLFCIGNRSFFLEEGSSKQLPGFLEGEATLGNP